MFKDLKNLILFIIIYISAFAVLDYNFDLTYLHVPLAIITVPGTVIGLILGFRTNSAYDRWWEARKIWGAIVNDSRSWVRQLLTYVDVHENPEDTKRRIRIMSLRHIAWNYVLANHLRSLEIPDNLEKYIDKEELRNVVKKTNKPNALLFKQSLELRELFEKKYIDRYQFIQLEETLVKFTDSMGKCERIKSTVFPSSYSFLVDLLIASWILFLPFGLVDNIGLIMLPAALSLAFSFLAIDRIAIYMQDPFENEPTDTPMSTISRNIEINIWQELNEFESAPEPAKPVNGVLM